MPKYRIALMPGDGIGKDVMDAAQIVLDKIRLDAEYVPADIGWEFWCQEGDPLPQRTIDTLETCNCALFAAITSKPKEEAEEELVPELQGQGLTYRSPIVRMRQIFDLYTNLRPCKAFKGNPLNYRDDVDLVVFRENTQGLYAGVEFYPLPGEVRAVLETHSPRMAAFEGVSSEDIAISCRIFTREGCRRIVRRAMAMWLIKNPQDYGVLVSSNMFGDIVSDLAAQLVGGLGFASSGNIGDDFAVFEPTHGSAPKYAGLYKVNPTAMLLAVKLMLDWLGETATAQALQQAIADTIAEGKVRTYDLGGSNTTLEVAQAVAERL
jgi:isocitrate/isopropylmalate dehydrogenase